MNIGRLISWGLLLAGLVLAVYSGYQWWGQLSITVHDPKLAKQIAKDWDDRKAAKALSKVGIAQKKITDKRGSTVGQLIIPRIGALLPIIEGTDPDSLKRGVGKFVGHSTVSPDQTGHVVLSGHRDTVFRQVGKLQRGDRLYIRYHKKIYTYQIRKTWVTDADDLTVIVRKRLPILTLTTCYPFEYVGSAPDRYIIRSELIAIQPDK